MPARPNPNGGKSKDDDATFKLTKLAVANLLDLVERNSIVIHEKSSSLSDTIAEVETRLQAMPGKVNASVEEDNVTLFFDRDHGPWDLVLIDDECDFNGGGLEPELLRSVSVARKARAFQLLPKLLNKIHQAQRNVLAHLDSALKATTKEGE